MRVSPSQRVGLITVALLVTTSAAALVLAELNHLGGAQTLVTLLVGGGAPAAVYLSWAQYHYGAVQAEAHGRMSLADVADRLAKEVRAQWQGEADVLNQPYPLPVSWQPADSSLFEEWATLIKVATTGVGWPAPSAVDRWALGPDALSGENAELVDVFDRVPTRRLVILGEAGSGKTTLMIRLVLDPRIRPASGDPVPVLVSVASWDPSNQEFHEWLAKRLSVDHPWLADRRHSDGNARTTHVEELIANGLIVPILDGLDEMSDPACAVGKLNESLHPGERLLVTSRAAVFESSVRPPSDVEVTLRAAAGVMLCPLDAADVASFLRDAAGGPQAQARWTNVIALLGSDVPVARVLSNPLMVSLASAIYNPSPSEVTDSGPGEPDDLSKLAGEEAIQRRLFDGFIRAAYRTRRADRRSRGWSARQAQPWFSFLAARLERVRKPDLAWWELVDAAPVSVMSLACGLAAGITFGLTAFLVAGLGSAVAAALGGGLAAWLTLYTFRAGTAANVLGSMVVWLILYMIVLGGAFVLMVVLTALLATVDVAASAAAGIIAGVVAGYAAFNISAPPASAARWRPRWAALLAGLVFGITGGVIVGITAGISSGLAGGLAAGLAALVAVGWKSGPGNPYKVPTPAVALARDRAAAIGPALSYGLAAGLPAGLSAGLSHHPPFGLPHGLTAGLVLAIATGLPFGLYFGSAAVQAEWRDWVLARVYLALRSQMPWRSMAFLSDAHARGVLRQAGAFYQFRSIELQRQLARRKVAMSSPADNNNEPI